MTTADALKSLKKIQGSHKRLMKKIAASSDAYAKSLIVGQEKLMTRMASMLAEMPADAKIGTRLAWYTKNMDSINDALIESGYIDASKAFVKDQLTLFRHAGNMMSYGGFDDAFTSVPKEWINYIQNRNLEYFKFLGTEAVMKLDKTMMEMIAGGYSRSAMLEELKGVITGSYKWGKKRGLYEWHAGTYANTAHHKSYQEFSNMMAEQVGAEFFVYVGPVDSRTRNFCLEIVGQTFSKIEILEMDNNSSGDVMSDRGGWNCRHNWAAVSGEMHEALKNASSEDIETAMRGGKLPGVPQPIGAQSESKRLDLWDWDRSLSKQEAQAFEYWMDEEPICSAMRILDRGGKIDPEDMTHIKNAYGMSVRDIQKQLDLIKKAIDRGEIYKAEEGTTKLWRGLKNLKKADYMKLRGSSGNIIELDALSSSSFDKYIAQEFADEGKYRAIFEISGNKTGVRVDNLNTWEEMEVLLRKGARFKVDKIVETGSSDHDLLTIFMTEL